MLPLGSVRGRLVPLHYQRVSARGNGPRTQASFDVAIPHKAFGYFFRERDLLAPGQQAKCIELFGCEQKLPHDSVA